MSDHSLRADTRDGFDVDILGSDAAGGLEAWFAPGAGMAGCSLLHRGEELLGQRRGVAYYAERHSTMGIPFLHPWANRAGGSRFELLGRQVDLERASGALYHDPNGLPMHGLLAGAPEWEVVDREAGPEGARLHARSTSPPATSSWRRFRSSTWSRSTLPCAARRCAWGRP